MYILSSEFDCFCEEYTKISSSGENFTHWDSLSTHTDFEISALFLGYSDLPYWILYTDLTVNFLDPTFLDLET